MTLAQVFSCEFCEIFKNIFFYRTPLVAASVNALERLKTFLKLFFCDLKQKSFESILSFYEILVYLVNCELNGDIFSLRLRNRPPRVKYKMNLGILKTNQVKSGRKSLRTFGPKIWNSLLHHIESAGNPTTFKKIIKK